MPENPTIHFHLSVEEILKIPFDCCNNLIDVAAVSGQLTPALVQTLYDAERGGKARWPVMNKLRGLLANPPRVACAACDRGDFQLGHADGCPKAHH